MPASQRVRECTAVNVLKLTTHRDTVSNATRFYSAPPRQLVGSGRSASGRLVPARRAVRVRPPPAVEERPAERLLHGGHRGFQPGASPVHLRDRRRIPGECPGATLAEWQAAVAPPPTRP